MTDCRLETIGREIAALNKAWVDVDKEEESARCGRRTYLSNFREEIEDRVEALKSEASLTAAKTPAGALVQIMIAASYLEELVDLIDDAEVSSRVLPLRRAMTRAIYSAANTVSSDASVNMETLGAGFLMRKNLSPFMWTGEEV